MAGARSNLFKWKRQTKPSSNVQRASDDAAREVFGGDYCSVLEQLHVDDDALVEAQDLLDNWLQDKEIQDLQPELEFYNEKWMQHRSVPKPLSQQRGRENDQLFTLTDDGTVEMLGDSYVVPDEKPPRPGAEYDQELDEEIAVQQVVRNMLDKRVVENDILSDLGFDDSRRRKDPRPKMELRHKQVKEKSENRRHELEKTRRERAARKEAELLARQQIMQEEKEKQSHAKREEMKMQKEMTKIRKAMGEDRKAKKEQMDREQSQLVEAEVMARQYMEEEQQCKVLQHRQEQEAREEMRRLLLQQMEEKAITETKYNLQVLQKYFSTWYSVVIEQRIKFGKASALADWKCKLRAWNAWRAYIWHIKSDKEAQAIATEMKDRHRKEQLALRFHRRHVLQHCFSAWQHYVRQSEHERQMREEHYSKTNKMAALLDAAASGRLWSKYGGDMGMGEGRNKATTQGGELLVQDMEDERPNTASKVDDIFSQDPRKAPVKQVLSARSNLGDNRPTFVQKRDNIILPNKPLKQAWGNQPPMGEQKIKQNLPPDRPRNSGLNIATSLSEGSRNNVMTKPNKRQRTLSHADKVEDLRLRLKEQTKNRPIDKGITRSRSVDVLDVTSSSSQARGTGSETNMLAVNQTEDGQSDLWADLETERSAASSKLLSREAIIKSEKPTTKPLHLAMEERANERATRKALLDERKRKLEEEKLAKLRLEQERKEMALVKEKQDILKKKREEKRLAHERELEKQLRLEEIRNLSTQAEQHYCKTLLLKYGLSPWRQLVAMARENVSCAVEHHSQALVITCFYPWLQYTRESKRRKEEAADQLYQKILVKRSWRSWRKYGQHMIRLEAVAMDYCGSYLLRKYYRLWQDYITNEQILYWEKERRAEEHNQWRLQKLGMTYWKKLIPMIKAERQKETRRLEMRKRVKAWLPDFQGSCHGSSP